MLWLFFVDVRRECNTHFIKTVQRVGKFYNTHNIKQYQKNLHLRNTFVEYRFPILMTSHPFYKKENKSNDEEDDVEQFVHIYLSLKHFLYITSRNGQDDENKYSL